MPARTVLDHCYRHETYFLRVLMRLVPCRAMSGQRRWLWGVIFATVLALGSIADSRGFRRYFQLRQEIRTMSDRNRQMQDQNRNLLREINALRSEPQALERAAREELGFVKPGEIVLNME